MATHYERLFKYRSTDKHTRLKNYLTEALCDLLNRIGEENAQAQVNIVQSLFACCNYVKKVKFITQSQIRLSSGKSRIPDLAGWSDDKNFSLVCLVEVKVGVGFTGETMGGAVAQDEEGTPLREEGSHQLKAYGEWIKENRYDGAKLVLLTHRTPPPPDFLEKNGKYGVPIGDRQTLRWQAVYNALVAHAESGHSYSALIKDFCHFLQTQGIAMATVTAPELHALVSFISTGAANSVQRFMNSLRDQCEGIAHDNSIACSRGQGLNFQYGGQFVSDHTLIGWVNVKVKNRSAQIAWGFHFDVCPTDEDSDPFWFRKLFKIPQGSGVFLNLVYDEEILFPDVLPPDEVWYPQGRDWYPCEKGAKAQTPAVAYMRFEAPDNTEEIGPWLLEKFTDVCKFIKLHEK